MTAEQTLNDAHRLLRAGKVDGAIAAYASVLEDRPDDWPAANRLGDLYMQNGKTEEAFEKFTTVARHLLERGLLPKAAALYKKVLKIKPEDEHARMQLAEIGERQGFLLEARTHLTAVLEQRRQAGDDAGAAELELRIEQLHDSQPDAGAAVPAPPQAASPPDQHADRWQIDKGMMYEWDRADGSSDTAPASPEPVATADAPADDRATAEPLRRAEEDPEPTALDRQLQLKLMLIENEIQAGRLRRARQLIDTVLTNAPEGLVSVVDLAKRMTSHHAEATLICVELLLEAGQRPNGLAGAAEAARDLALWVPVQPEGSRWPAEQLERLARADAAARLATMRRESDALLEAFPDLTAEEDGRTVSTVAPPPASAVVAAV